MKVELTKDVQKRMMMCLIKAKRQEIGGILMAEQVKPGEFRVVEFSLDDSTGSATHFVRSPVHHHAALTDFFARTGKNYSRYNYLGEWHSHPNYGTYPSTTDILSMHELLDEERNISFAILLIVKRGWWRKLLCSATLFRQGEEPSNIQVLMGS
ncbi:Mov34/MPN/PAD-1 family protein [Thiolapillus sp.]|uniref:Mov34/MPN/PAD-1 family protein n=1 Tax=Thiolapillus sp. TaxID=2017437 RepID=UPI0025EDAF7B|nr:Mov34/MPN/PAD-1 family protein [Thiolapillus sp.]